METDEFGRFIYPKYWNEDEADRPRIVSGEKPCKDQRFYKSWSESRTSCAACGISKVSAEKYRWPGLETHHIVKPGRSHEACNLIRLCRRCHQLAEGNDITGTIGGVEYIWDRLSIENVIWLKLLSEPKDVDLMRLSQLLGRYVEKPVHFDHIVITEKRFRMLRRPIDHHPWNVCHDGHANNIKTFLDPKWVLCIEKFKKKKEA